MKKHIKRLSTTRLALCGIWPDEDFILIGDVSVHQSQHPGTLCLVCLRIVANEEEPRDDTQT